MSQPGTNSASQLNKSIEYFIHHKFQYDETWKKFQIIFSSSNIPGDANYKIFQFISSQKSQKNENPNLTFGVYGLNSETITSSLFLNDFKIILMEQKLSISAPQQDSYYKTSRYQVLFFLLFFSSKILINFFFFFFCK